MGWYGLSIWLEGYWLKCKLVIEESNWSGQQEVSPVLCPTWPQCLQGSHWYLHAASVWSWRVHLLHCRGETIQASALWCLLVHLKHPSGIAFWTGCRYALRCDLVIWHRMLNVAKAAEIIRAAKAWRQWRPSWRQDWIMVSYRSSVGCMLSFITLTALRTLTVVVESICCICLVNWVYEASAILLLGAGMM